jgi:spermidine synthase
MRRLLRRRNKRYDIIVSEPSNPWVSGVSTLFSHEFYGQVRRYLKDDGVLVQWIQAYDISPDLLGTVFKALGSQFGDYVVYRVGGVGYDLLIVATPGKKLPPLSGEIFDFRKTAAELARLGYAGPRRPARPCASARARRSSLSSRAACFR